MSYDKQRKTIQEYRLAAFEEGDTKLTQEFDDILETVNKVERLERLLAEIRLCAAKRREFCANCDSIVKVIEDFSALEIK